MRKPLPPCPKCGELELWRAVSVELRVRCAECGWDSGVIDLDEGRLTDDEAIQATVIGTGMVMRSMEAFRERTQHIFKGKDE